MTFVHFLIRLQLVSHWIRCTTSCPAPWILGHENDFTSYAHSIQLVRNFPLFICPLKVSKTRKQIVKPWILPKNEQMNSTLLLWYLRSTCFCSFFGRNQRHQKNISKLNDLYQSICNARGKELFFSYSLSTNCPSVHMVQCVTVLEKNTGILSLLLVK